MIWATLILAATVLLLAFERIRVDAELADARAASDEATRRTEMLFDAMPDGLAVTDDVGTIVRLNAAGRELVGITVEDEPTSRRSLADLANPLVQALREGNTAAGLEVAIAAFDAPRIIQVKLAKLSHLERSRAAVALFRDVTRERVLEHDLRRKKVELEAHVEALLRATELKSAFVANMSHELRTPLNAVLGFTEVLLEGSYGPLNPKQSGCAEDVLAAGRHLLGLINDILDLSKIEAGRMELALDDVEVHAIAAQALTFVRPQAVAKSIELTMSMPPESMSVRGDPDRVRQVLINLLSNAVKFTPAHGVVSIRAEAAAEGSVMLSVTDNGIGISAADAEKLFKDFSQVDSSITRRFGGSGLGLAICRRLVELHGGQIDFESMQGQGSRFFFTLPRAKRSQRPTFGITRPMRSISGRAEARVLDAPPSVLILDADAAAARLIELALAEDDVRAVIANTLADAREILRTSEVEAIVVDPSLPGTDVADGMTFARLYFPNSHVIATAMHGEELGLDPKHYLPKPLDRSLLRERVRAARRRTLPRRALIVDALEDAATVSALLQSDGFEVEVVSTLAEARLALNHTWSVVVTELVLPDGEGRTLLEEIRDRRDHAAIVLTAEPLAPHDMEQLAGLARLVLVKGTLSRSTFLRHVAAVAGDVAPRRRRVLAVDDNDQNLRLITAVLARRGYDILEARDALSAVDIARAERPDLILMDVMLPDVDGLSATRQLKKDALTRAIPVIAVTARAMQGDAERAMAAGCADYVTKPIDSTRLIGAVERAIKAA